MQGNLNKWLKIKDLKLPKYFYWKWGHNAYWTSEELESNFKVEINWKEYNHKFYLLGNFPDSPKYKLEKVEEEDFKISIIKSHIQKCIRRKMHIKAVRSAYNMIDLDFNQFIRRINIIMLEDTCLMDSYYNLIWMMLAFSTKLWEPLNIHIEWLLGLVHNLCDTVHIVVYDKKNIHQGELYLDNIGELEKSMIYSLQIRKSYGGMICDLDMIQSIINGLKLKNIEIIKKPVRRVSLVMKYLPFQLYELSAVDFHCVPYIISSVKQKFPFLFEDEIKNLIWEYRSGINLRHKSQNKINENYLKIDKFLNNFSINILKKL